MKKKDQPPNVLRFLPAILVNETGCPYLSIYRKERVDGIGYGSDTPGMTVGEFLSREENCSGSWYIDGGWGGPPGPSRVDWEDDAKAWVYRGFPLFDNDSGALVYLGLEFSAE